MACASVLSQYSPFFTSGLLTSTLPREVSSKPVRRSEPLTVNTHNIYSNSRAPRSAVDLSHRDRLQSGHSFLTLDIMEPRQGSPSPSRRTLTSQRSVPILRQSARENPRIPSPKPAPSVSLPAIPQESLRDSTSVSKYSQAGPSQRLSIPTGGSTPTADESYLFISPLASPRLTSSSHPSRALPPLRLPPLVSQNRSAALAALEGRSSRDLMDVSSKARNFMNMSDDEEDLSGSQERVPSSYFEDDSDDEDDDEFFSFPESSVLPTSLPPWQGSPKRQNRNITSYSPPPASFIDFGDVEEHS